MSTCVHLQYVCHFKNWLYFMMGLYDSRKVEARDAVQYLLRANHTPFRGILRSVS